MGVTLLARMSEMLNLRSVTSLLHFSLLFSQDTCLPELGDLDECCLSTELPREPVLWGRHPPVSSLGVALACMQNQVEL